MIETKLCDTMGLVDLKVIEETQENLRIRQESRQITWLSGILIFITIFFCIFNFGLIILALLLLPIFLLAYNEKRIVELNNKEGNLLIISNKRILKKITTREISYNDIDTFFIHESTSATGTLSLYVKKKNNEDILLFRALNDWTIANIITSKFEKFIEKKPSETLEYLLENGIDDSYIKSRLKICGLVTFIIIMIIIITMVIYASNSGIIR